LARIHQEAGGEERKCQRFWKTVQSEGRQWILIVCASTGSSTVIGQLVWRPRFEACEPGSTGVSSSELCEEHHR